MLQGELGPWSEPEEVISRLILMLKQTKMQQSPDYQQGQQGARVMSTDELSELSYEQLIEQQDNLNMVRPPAILLSGRIGPLEGRQLTLVSYALWWIQAIVRTREREQKCPVCLDKPKDSVCVPCGHRYCNAVRFPECSTTSPWQRNNHVTPQLADTSILCFRVSSFTAQILCIPLGHAVESK